MPWSALPRAVRGLTAGPDLDPTDEPELPFAARVRRLELRARRLLDSRALGAYDSVFRGHGIEFSEVRAYQPGDPFQAIDWKVTARAGRPFVKRFVEERELPVLLALDVSASTAIGSRGRAKRTLGWELAGVLGLAAIRNADRVGLLLFSDRVEHWSPPRRGRHRLRRLLQVAVSHRPVGRGTDVAVALRASARALRSRSLLFVISDFRSAPFGRALAAAARRHDVVGLELVDPREREPPPAGLIEVRDPESGRRRILDLGRRETRERIAEAETEREERLARLFRRCGCDRLPLRIDRPFDAELARFFAARARARLR